MQIEENDKQERSKVAKNVDYKSEEPPFQLGPKLEELIDNPLNLGDYMKVKACKRGMGGSLVYQLCEYWCQEYNIAKSTPHFDGDPKRMLELYK